MKDRFYKDETDDKTYLELKLKKCFMKFRYFPFTYTYDNSFRW